MSIVANFSVLSHLILSHRKKVQLCIKPPRVLSFSLMTWYFFWFLFSGFDLGMANVQIFFFNLKMLFKYFLSSILSKFCKSFLSVIQFKCVITQKGTMCLPLIMAAQEYTQPVASISSWNRKSIWSFITNRKLIKEIKCL